MGLGWVRDRFCTGRGARLCATDSPDGLYRPANPCAGSLTPEARIRDGCRGSAGRRNPGRGIGHAPWDAECVAGLWYLRTESTRSSASKGPTKQRTILRRPLLKCAHVFRTLLRSCRIDLHPDHQLPLVAIFERPLRGLTTNTVPGNLGAEHHCVAPGAKTDEGK